MARQDRQFDVRAISARDPDFLSALHLVLDLPRPASGTIEPQAKDLLTSARQGCADLELMRGAYRAGELVSACLAVEAPGKVAMLLAPSDLATASATQATYEAACSVVAASWSRSIQLLEALISPEKPALGSLLADAGFRYLTALIYLTTRAPHCMSGPRPAAGLRWVSYSPEHEQLFGDILDRSYAQSLDCPELSGLRPASDVLATHRARREFDPGLWWVALAGDDPVGVLLLNRIPPQPGLEIVYIGVAQLSRGTGVADSLLMRTASEAERCGAKFVTLAADRRNAPARKMYARWGFVETLTREAFIATPPVA